MGEVAPLNLPSGVIVCPRCDSRAVQMVNASALIRTRDGHPFVGLEWVCGVGHRFKTEFTSYPDRTIMSVRVR